MNCMLHALPQHNINSFMRRKLVKMKWSVSTIVTLIVLLLSKTKGYTFRPKSYAVNTPCPSGQNTCFTLNEWIKSGNHTYTNGTTVMLLSGIHFINSTLDFFVDPMCISVIPISKLNTTTNQDLFVVFMMLNTLYLLGCIHTYNYCFVSKCGCALGVSITRILGKYWKSWLRYIDWQTHDLTGYNQGTPELRLSTDPSVQHSV